MTNGTSTLHLILVALGIGPGDEVIIPAFSYIATANAVEVTGATPIFVDISTDTFNIETTLIEEKITQRTKAVIIVHEFGLPADCKAISNMCERHGLRLIEDAACALGAMEDNQFVGTFGIAGSFSFHPRKAITSGEGGMVVTHDRELSDKLRALRNHGIRATSTNEREFIMPGYNCRMTDIQAALLITQLTRLPEILMKRQKIAERYKNEITNKQIQTPACFENKTHTWQTFHVLLSPPLEQEKIFVRLRKANIGVNRGAQCMPAQAYYATKYKLDLISEFPNAMNASCQGMAVPLYEKLDDLQVSTIINQLNRI